MEASIRAYGLGDEYMEQFWEEAIPMKHPLFVPAIVSWLKGEGVILYHLLL